MNQLCRKILTLAPTLLASQLAAAVAGPLPGVIEEFKQRQGYMPTILHSQQELDYVFKLERQLNHDSMCHERAEVWSYEISQHRDASFNNYKLMKVMMFYTPRFRNTFRHKGDIYKWWYHTAPLTFLDTGSGPVPYVLDREFLNRPVTLDEWSKHFLIDEIKPKQGGYIPFVDETKIGRYLTPQEAQCQVISNYRDYAVPAIRGNMNTPWCMMRIYPMYYMQPDDLMQMDCDPAHDTDYTIGLDPGRKVGLIRRKYDPNILDKRLNDGRYKYACPPNTPALQRGFRKGDLDVSFKHTSE